MSGTLTWDHAVADIPESGLSTVRRAAPDELELIVRALGLITCSSLTATYTIMAIGTKPSQSVDMSADRFRKMKIRASVAKPSSVARRPRTSGS